jgi:type VI secretion system secreted protein VgrG
MTKHPAAGFDGTYLLTMVQLRATERGGYSSTGESEMSYENQFQCVPATVPYRPPRLTPEPKVMGVQTAVVVGPAGEEIYVDKYGRVKVHFFWDREGKRNENSSCWIRVSQNWAGKNWGGIFHPRIGQEVIVDFIEGDPDRPIITGRVYNAEQVVPYDLPAKKTHSGINSRSSRSASKTKKVRSRSISTRRRTRTSSSRTIRRKRWGTTRRSLSATIA